MGVKSVLIIGSSGFVGTHIALRLREKHKVFATYYQHPMNIAGVTNLHLAVENKNWIKRIVYTAKPDVVIYAVGKPFVEWAERNPRPADFLHATAPADIANVSEIFQPKFIYLSSCYAFDGMRGNYHEGDIPLPTTALGKAKIGGENFIKGRCLNYLIVRSTPLIGRGNGQNLSFIDQLRMKLDRGQRIEMNDRDLHAFAPIDGFMDMISRLVDSGVRNKVFHYGGLTKMTYLQFGNAFAKKFGYDPSLIIANANLQNQSINTYLDPLDYSLNFTAAVEALKIKPFLVEECLDLIEEKLVPHA